MATYLADRVIVYEGSPGLDCVANAPTSLVAGMNKFLKVRAASARAAIAVKVAAPASTRPAL
jgi:ATP-binding cassette subfamily E protein 1